MFNNFKNMILPIRLCSPITINANLFFDKHGEFFMLNSSKRLSNGIEAKFSTGYGEEITIRKTTDGIFVNGELFCEKWEDSLIK